MEVTTDNIEKYLKNKKRTTENFLKLYNWEQFAEPQIVL